jgi:FemAB-related protein (PEP-CTERM system-associated)
MNIAEQSPVDAQAVPELSIEIREETDGAAWDAFLATQPHSSFYHLSGWRAVNEGVLGHRCFQLAARSAEGIVGVLPLVLVSSPLFGRILCSMPFVNFGGPCSGDERVIHALLAAARAEAGKLRVDYLELRCAAPLETDLPSSLRKISMTISLAPDPDTLWNAFTSKHRKNVKRAYKDDLAVKSGGIELLPQFYALMQQSWRNLGTPLYSRKYFESVLRTFPDNSRIFVCHQKETPIAVAMCGYHNGVVEGLWAGGGPLARKLDANFVLYWEMIRDACLRGYRSFHLGRSTADSGGEEFKRKWNADSKQLYWYFHRPGGGEMPALNVDNPKYKLAIAAWRKLPLPVTRLIGPPLARLIP